MSVKEHLEAFVDSVTEMRERLKAGDDVFNTDFQKLKHNSLRYRREMLSRAGEQDINMKKNRYKDILPFDETRVTLPEIPNVDGSDYINANFIRGVGHRQQVYIASQGPLPSTVVDYWRMLWSYNIKVIVMACKLLENGKSKCEKYWPEPTEERTFGEITVSVKSQKQQSQNVTARVLCAKKGNVTRVLYQYHYTAWPDHGIPSSPIPIVAMVKLFREEQSHDNTPIVIHCSAGCGRTGAIMVIDYVMKLLENELLDSKFNLYDLIDEMRRQRTAIVQTRDQYEFVHYAVSELMLEELRNKYEDYSEHTYENVCLVDEKRPEFSVELPAKTGVERPEPRIVLPAERKKQMTSSYVNVTLADEESPPERNIGQDKPTPAPRSPKTGRANPMVEKPSPAARLKQIGRATISECTPGIHQELLALPVKQRSSGVPPEPQNRSPTSSDKFKPMDKPPPPRNKPKNSTSEDISYERVKPGTVSSAMMAFMQDPTPEPTLPKKKSSPDDKKMKSDQTDVSHHGAVAMVTKEQLKTQLMKSEEKRQSDISPRKEENHEYEPIDIKTIVDERKKDERHRNTPVPYKEHKGNMKSQLSVDDGQDKKDNIQKALTNILAVRQKEAEGSLESSPRVAPKRNKKAKALVEAKDVSVAPVPPRKISQSDLETDGDAYAIISEPKPRNTSTDYEDITLSPPTNISPSQENQTDAESEYAVVQTKSAGKALPPKMQAKGKSQPHDARDVVPALPLRTEASFQMCDDDTASDGKDSASVSSFGSSDSLEQRSEQGGSGFKVQIPKFLRRGAAKMKKNEDPPEKTKQQPMDRRSLPNRGLPSNIMQDLEDTIRHAKEQHSPTFVQGPTVHHLQDISYPNRPFKTNGPREPPRRWQQQPSANSEPIQN